MPGVLVVDEMQAEREVDVPTTCPGCQADLTESYSLKVYSSAVIMQQARFLEDGTIDDYEAGDSGDIGPTVEVRCAGCDYGLTEGREVPNSHAPVVRAKSGATRKSPRRKPKSGRIGHR